MGNIFYNQLLDRLEKDGEVNTLTAISNNGNLGDRVVLDNSGCLENNNSKFFSSIKDKVKFKKGTYCEKYDNEEIFVESIYGKPKLVICGGGHIALPLSRMGKMLEFDVTVIDNRPEFANSKRFPHADCVICRDFNEGLEKAGLNSNTYVVIVTRGHVDDRNCLCKVIKMNHKYVGMIGSRSKAAFVFNKMKEDGYSEEELKNVYTPVGLDIGAETPEEIAVSIFAEIIQIKNKNLISYYEEDIINKLKYQKEDMVLATIVEKTGSCPRGVGAKMLMSKDGSFAGTVGGGRVESEVYKKAMKLIELQKHHIESYNLSNSKAATLGMACGGTIRVLYEYIKSEF